MNRTKQESVRLGLFFVVMTIFFMIILLRLVHLQVVLADEYLERVEKQSGGEVAIPSTRGVIFDRNGNVIANNLFVYSLYAYPESEKELKEISDYLSDIFSLSRNRAVKKFDLRIKKFRWIERKISDKFAEQIEENVPHGLYLRREAKRDYPFGQVGKQIVGFTSIDNKGLSGFEYSFDSLLMGKKGWADIRRDGLRNTYRVKEQALVKPIQGQSIVLTLDFKLQQIVEEEIKLGLEKYNAKSAMAAFLNCNTGEILAMAHYDPSERNPDKPQKLRVIADQWEPGSIFKVLTASAILDNNLVDFEDSIYCEKGLWKINRNYLHDDKELEWLTFREIMELSSNIGIAKFAIELGGEEILERSKSFGLGQKMLQVLPGETSGKINPPPTWSDYNTAVLSIGHSIAVSTLQMAVAFGVIANGGELIRPRLVLGRVDENGYVVDQNNCEVISRVMMAASADSLRSFLRGVVERGTAEAANSPVVNIAGKTGTAQIYDVERKRYFRSKFMASFAGFFPAEDPIIAGIIVYEEPHPIHYGGWTSGPTFKRIAERYAVLNPDFFTAQNQLLSISDFGKRNTVEVPDLIGRKLVEVKIQMEQLGLKSRINNKNGYVVWQYPRADRLLFKGDELILIMQESATEQLKMIDMKGLSIREMSAFCDFAKINFEINGKGQVVRQSIKPGVTLTENSFCLVTCCSS